MNLKPNNMESLIFLLVFMSGVLIAWYSFNKFLVGITVPEGPKIVKEVHIPEFVYKEIETDVKDALLELSYVDRCFDIDFGDYVIEFMPNENRKLNIGDIVQFLN